MAGYSGTPLLKKLGIKPNYKVLLVHPPEHYIELLGELPDGVEIISTSYKPEFDVRKAVVLLNLK